MEIDEYFDKVGHLAKIAEEANIAVHELVEEPRAKRSRRLLGGASIPRLRKNGPACWRGRCREWVQSRFGRDQMS